MVQTEVGIDVFRDGLEGGGTADSRESVNGTIALLVAFGRASCSKCCVHIGGRALGIPKSNDCTHHSVTETVISFHVDNSPVLCISQPISCFLRCNFSTCSVFSLYAQRLSNRCP